MKSIIYQEISNLEAMTLIDKNDTSKLYFVELYYESEYPYGSNGHTGHSPNPKDVRQTEPIKYKSSIIVRTRKLLSPFKEIEAVPGEVLFKSPNRIYIKHRWLVKIEELKHELRIPGLYKKLRSEQYERQTTNDPNYYRWDFR